MTAQTDDDQAVEGAELASELIPAVSALLLAGLVRRDGELAIELGLWQVADGGLAAPDAPLLINVRDLPAVRTLAECAIAKIPGAAFDADGEAHLAAVGNLNAAAFRAVDRELFILSWANRSADTWVPLADATAMARVLAAAEMELVELGVIPMPASKMN